MLSLSNESVNPFISNIIIVYCTISGNSFKWLFKLKNKLNINKLLKILLNCNNHPIFSFSRYNVQYNASVNLKTHIKHKNLSFYVLKLWLKKIWKPIKNTENKMAKKERRKTTIHIFFQSRAVHNFSITFSSLFQRRWQPRFLWDTDMKNRGLRENIYMFYASPSREANPISAFRIRMAFEICLTIVWNMHNAMCA